MFRYLFIVSIGKFLEIFNPYKLKFKLSFGNKWKHYRSNIFDTPVKSVFPTIDATTCMKNWNRELTRDAKSNSKIYQKIFSIENLLRLLVNELPVVYSRRIKEKISNFQSRDNHYKNVLNINVIDDKCNVLHFLNTYDLIYLIKKSNKHGYLFYENLNEFSHYRNIIAHNGIITIDAQYRLMEIYNEYVNYIELILKDIFE